MRHCQARQLYTCADTGVQHNVDSGAGVGNGYNIQRGLDTDANIGVQRDVNSDIVMDTTFSVLWTLALTLEYRVV